jgi:hypothetical protein
MSKRYIFAVSCVLSVLITLSLYSVILTMFGIVLSLNIIGLGFVLAMLATVSIGTHIFIKMFAKE